MTYGRLLADLALRVISSPEGREFVTNALGFSATQPPRRTGTGSRQGVRMPLDPQVKEARAVVKAFSEFLALRAEDICQTMPEQMQTMAAEKVQEDLENRLQKLLSQDQWDAEKLTELSSLFFWLAVPSFADEGTDNAD